MATRTAAATTKNKKRKEKSRRRNRGPEKGVRTSGKTRKCHEMKRRKDKND